MPLEGVAMSIIQSESQFLRFRQACGEEMPWCFTNSMLHHYHESLVGRFNSLTKI